MGLFGKVKNKEESRYFVREGSDFYVLRELFDNGALKDKIWQYNEGATRKAQYISPDLYNELKIQEEANELQEGLLKKILETDMYNISGGWVIKPGKFDGKLILNGFGPIIEIRQGEPPETKVITYGDSGIDKK